MAETIEYIVTPAVVVTFIGGYMDSIVDDLFWFSIPTPVWWLIFYLIFLGAEPDRHRERCFGSPW